MIVAWTHQVARLGEVGEFESAARTDKQIMGELPCLNERGALKYQVNSYISYDTSS